MVSRDVPGPMLGVLVILLHTIVGIAILAVVGAIPVGSTPRPFAMLAAFVGFNLIVMRTWKLRAAALEYWSLKRLPLFIPGLVLGLTLALIPIGMSALIHGSGSIAFRLTTLSVTSTLLTLATVAWEEWWFRGIYLNLARRSLNPVGISLTVGLLFVCAHALNPEIDLLRQAPALFCAGTLLTLLYFYSRSLWLPLGVHFGNNVLGSLTQTSVTSVWFGSDGFVSAIVLLLLIVIVHKRMRILAHDTAIKRHEARQQSRNEQAPMEVIEL